MPLQLLPPQFDPAPIFEIFRGNYAMELLTAAVAHFGIFERLAAGPIAAAELRSATGLGERQFVVLLTGLRALRLVEEKNARLQMTPIAGEHLAPGGPLDVSDYIRLAAEAPGVLALVEQMRKNKPAEMAKGDERAMFIYREGLDSAMEEDQSARHLIRLRKPGARVPLLARPAVLRNGARVVESSKIRRCVGPLRVRAP